MSKFSRTQRLSLFLCLLLGTPVAFAGGWYFASQTMSTPVEQVPTTSVESTFRSSTKTPITPFPDSGDREETATQTTNSSSATSSSSSSTSETESTETSSDSATSEEADTGSATADGVNDFNACEADIDLYCSGFGGGNWEEFAEENGYTTASWKLGLVDCLSKNPVSQTCEDSQNRREALNEDVITYCAADRGKFCQGVEPIPGQEPMVDCLMEHHDELEPECVAAVDAHEDAKSIE